MLLDLHSAGSADHQRAHGAFCGRLETKGGAEIALSFSERGNLKLAFVDDAA